MPKNKTGLHKEISVIFDGVPIPKKNGAQQSSDAPTPEYTDHVPPKPPTPDQPTSPTPKSQQPTQPQPEVALPKQPEAALPEQPEAAPPEQPEAALPEQPEAALPEQPEAAPPEQPEATPPEQPEVAPSKRPKAAPPKQPEAAPLERPEAAPPKQPEVVPPKQPEAALPEQPEAAPPKQPEAAPPKKLEDALLKPPEADATIKAAKQAPWQQVWQQIQNKLFAPKPGVSATKQKVIVILVPVLLIFLIFMLTQVLSTPSRVTSGPRSFEPTKTITSSNNKIDWRTPEQYLTTLRDPMQFGSVRTAQSELDRAPGKLIIKGIVYSKDNACAMIGGQILYEGDQVSGATIVKITKRSVEFEKNGKKWTQKVQ